MLGSVASRGIDCGGRNQFHAAGRAADWRFGEAEAADCRFGEADAADWQCGGAEAGNLRKLISQMAGTAPS